MQSLYGVILAKCSVLIFSMSLTLCELHPSTCLNCNVKEASIHAHYFLLMSCYIIHSWDACVSPAPPWWSSPTPWPLTHPSCTWLIASLAFTLVNSVALLSGWAECFFLRKCQKMDTTPCDAAVTMYHLTTAQQLNASCNCSSSPCNWTAGGDALKLPTFTTAAKVRVIITFILCAVSAFCNLAVLWAAHSDGKRKSHVRVLIINLTVADLLVTFIVMPVDAVWNITVQWLAGDFACRLLMFLKLQAMYSCAFVTVVISLDRQSAILNPLAINEARKRNRVMLCVAWSTSAVLSVPQVRTGRPHMPDYPLSNVFSLSQLCLATFTTLIKLSLHEHEHFIPGDLQYTLQELFSYNRKPCEIWNTWSTQQHEELLGTIYSTLCEQLCRETPMSTAAEAIHTAFKKLYYYYHLIPGGEQIQQVLFYITTASSSLMPHCYKTWSLSKTTESTVDETKLCLS